MLDLLNVASGRRCDTAAVDGDPLPVGVAARLGLLLAASRDFAVLTGAMLRGTPDQQKERRALLRESAAAAGTFEVDATVSVPVRCGRGVHRLELRPDGFLSTAHPDLDVEGERVAAALGGELLPCVREIVAARAWWEPPVAFDGAPSQPSITAGELLAFVITCRTWLARGFTLSDSAQAVERGLAYEQIQPHLDRGLDLCAAAEWSLIRADRAVRWVAIGFSASDAKLWLSQRRTLAEAEAAAQAAGGGRWLARWARVTGNALDSPAVAAWASVGLPVGVWGEVASRGVRAEEAGDWLVAGFTPVEVLRYSHLKVALDEALTWRQQGFTAYVAAGCLGVGMTLADACALRGLPTRDVQDAWRHCGSVEEVRSEVEAKLAAVQAAELSLR